MLIYLTLIFSIYFGFLLVCNVGWRKFTMQSKPLFTNRPGFISVVVAVRDEEDTVLPLLDSLRFQDFPHRNFEIIFVDDHSIDRTQQIISDWITDNPQIGCRYLQGVGMGKKNALTEAIQNAKGELILTTDADCVLPADWISRMAVSFDKGTTMVIGLVKIRQEKSLFSKLQALEFSSLMGSGIALQSIGFPVMCNGASLAFRKKSFETVNGYEGNLHIPSGDDEFLMRKLKKQFPGSIQSVLGTSVVTTRHQLSLKNFIHQRLRWAGKWQANESITTKLLAVFILIFQLTFIVTLLFLVQGKFLVGAVPLVSMKCLLEGYFLYKVSRTLHQNFSITSFLLLQLIYPIYVVTIGIAAQLLDYEWKGRMNSSSD